MSLKTIPGDLRRQEAQLAPAQRLVRWYRRHREAIIAWSFLTPMLIYFIVMTYIPFGFSDRDQFYRMEHYHTAPSGWVCKILKSFSPTLGTGFT